MSDMEKISFLTKKKVPKRVRAVFSTRPGKISFLARRKRNK